MRHATQQQTVSNVAATALQGNPLGGGGLTTVSEGICLNSTLTAINLADIGVSDDDLPGLESFRNALLMHPVMFKVGIAQQI